MREAAPPRLPLRLVVWALHMVLPLLGLWLLVAKPPLDVRWENHDAHFWLVLSTAAVSFVLASAMNAEAARRHDARLFLVSMAFAAGAGFLGLHALATPGLLLGRNTGFVVATPIGLLVAAVFAGASAIDLTPRVADGVMRARRLIRWLLAAALLVWLVATLLRVAPLDRPISAPDAEAPLVGLMLTGAVLYLGASARYYSLHRRRPSVMLVSVTTAFFLFAEAMVAIAYGRSWQASWWEWHVLMAAGFVFVGYSAFVEWTREGSPTGLFGAISLAETLQRVREEYSAALEAMVTVIEQRGRGSHADVAPAAARLRDRFDLTERQAEVLVKSAEALAHEREQIRRQEAMVAAGREASVIRREEQLLERVLGVVAPAFGDELRVALLRDGKLEALNGGSSPQLDALRESASREVLSRLTPVERPTPEGALLALPLAVKGNAAGILWIDRTRGSFADRDRALLASFASQLSIALENTRLYRQLDALFRSYMAPEVVTSLLADPEQAALGGAIVEVSVLMGDLSGFTSYSERTRPDQVVQMLNSHFGTVVPVVLSEGGTVTQFIGDAIMAIFNAPARQQDHALRAVRCALRAQQATARASQPGWPRFRFGVNTGPALVGNIGAPDLRNFTAIGDTVNLAARLEAAAPVGGVVISERTYASLGHVAEVEPLGSLELKGKSERVAAFRLVRLRGQE
ncbi:MAG TPA: adenylate/guanylate cyclase domain-containing protein [Candidatus Sulfotelmatobacter sp.]|nr:adenylate/guanylate cyclase domain-containing protein [Candidatus Sulfotelmatobacter sp.]